MDDLLLIYAVIISLELVLSLVMLVVLLLAIAPVGRTDDPGEVQHPVLRSDQRFPDDLERSLRLAFTELSRGSRDVALMTHTRTLLQKHQRQGLADERH